jgi:hypothetical protein
MADSLNTSMDFGGGSAASALGDNTRPATSHPRIPNTGRNIFTPPHVWNESLNSKTAPLRQAIKVQNGTSTLLNARKTIGERTHSKRNDNFTKKLRLILQYQGIGLVSTKSDFSCRKPIVSQITDK